MADDLVARIEVLELQPGDILVLTPPHRLREADHRRLKGSAASAFQKRGVQVVINDLMLDLSVLRQQREDDG